MRTPSTVLRAVVAVGLLLTPTLTGCGGEPETPGVTDEEIRVGTTLPLSGPQAAAGTAALAGVRAYFQAVNDTGGVSLKDGTRRKVRLIHYDDGHDPARAVRNYHRLVDRDQVFALVQTFGTASNRELMKLANRDKVPQVFVHSGASEFNVDQEHNRWTIGWQPMYETEGAWHALLVMSGGHADEPADEQGEAHADEQRDEPADEHGAEPRRVAVLSRDDDIGKAFVHGFERTIEGSHVEIVARQSYQPGDRDVHRQVGKLARSKADLLFSVVPDTDLQVAVLRGVRALDWSATVLLTSQNSSIERVIKPSGVTDGVRATGFVKQPDDPQWAGDSDVREYLDRMRRYSPQVDPTLPNAEWGYSAAASFARVLEGMAYISREQLMESVNEVAGEAPLLLPAVKLDGISPELPPVQGVWLQEFRGGKWILVEPRDEHR
jgi:branched-chain amino acid transport system substrate-binding protein